MVWATGIDCARANALTSSAACEMCTPPPAQQHRPLGPGQQPDGARDVVGRRPAADGRGRLAARIDGELLLVEGQRAVADVLRHRHHHGTRPAAGRDLEGAPDQLGDAAGILDAQQLLARRAQDLGLPCLLRHVLAGVQPVAVADEGDDRRAGVERLHQAGGEIGGAGPQGCIHQADAARHLGVGVGGERAAALVVDEVVIELEPPRRIVERQQLEAAHAEHRPGVESLEHAGHGLAARHLVRLRHRGCLSLFDAV